MTFEDLELFWAIAECPSITEAAQSVSISQPTASRRLKAMEKELGQHLIERDMRPLRLTPLGFRFLNFADEVLKQYRELIAVPVPIAPLVGRLTIATSSSPAARLVTRWLAEFLADYPGVRVELNEMNTREVEDRLADGSVLLGFMGLCSKDPALTAMAIANDEIVLLVPRCRPYSQIPRPARWSDLRNLPFVMRRAGSATQAVVEAAFDRLLWPKPDHIVLEVDTASALIDAVETGLGAGFVSRELLFRRQLRHSQRLEVQGLELTRPFYLAYHSERVASQPVALQFVHYAEGKLSSES